MKILVTLFVALWLLASNAYSVISVNEQITRIDFSYSSGVAIATLATSDGSLGTAIAPFTANLATDTQFKLTLAAPTGMQFVAQMPQLARFFVQYLNFNSSDFKGSLLTTDPVVTYTGFVGSGGDYSGGGQFTSPANGSSLGLNASTNSFSSSFAFQSVSILWTYNPLTFTTSVSTTYLPTGGNVELYANMVNTNPGNWVQIKPIPEPVTSILICLGAFALIIKRFASRRHFMSEQVK